MSGVKGRNYTLIVDKSGSMARADGKGGKSRWEQCQESSFALAAKCEKLDPDGITLYVFAGRFVRYDNVKAAKIETIFEENEPAGGTNLAAVLQDAVNNYLQRRRAGAPPETILVITDGEPDDQRAVMKVIIDATRAITRDEELAFSFIQVGKDEGAARFLSLLDNELSKAGAAFDIVDTINMEEIEEVGLTEVLLRAIQD